MKTISLKKRIALVAVAALGSSLVTVAPATAVAAAGVSAVNATVATSAPAVSSAVTVNVGLTTTNVAAGSVSIKAAFLGASDYPSGGWVAVSAVATPSAGSAAYGTTGLDTTEIDGAELILSSDPAAGTIASSTTTGVGSFTFTPTKAGTYILTVWHEADNGGTVDAVNSSEARQTVSITVAAAATASGGTSRMVVASGNTAYGVGSTSAGSDTGIIGDRTITASGSTGQRAVASVQVRNSSGAVMNGATLAASVSGPGLVLVNTSSAAAIGTARSSSLALTGASEGYVHVSGDGTSGKGTITVTVTDPVTAATTTVGTFDVTFYSTTVATLTATANYVNIGSGVTTGCSSVTCLGTTYSTGSAGKPAVSIVAKDASGMVIPNLTLVQTIADATVISTTTVTGANSNDANGLGYYNVSVTGAATSTSGKTTTVTWSAVNSATSVITSNAITFTAAGTTIASETLEFNKTSYVAGDPMVITRTAKDAAGNPVADGTASPAVTFSKTVGGTAPAAGVYVAGKSATSATAPTVFAPVTGGAFTATMTGGDAAATVRTASSSVVDGNAALLTQIDALNAKIVALNALIAKIMKRLGVK